MRHAFSTIFLSFFCICASFSQKVFAVRVGGNFANYLAADRYYDGPYGVNSFQVGLTVDFDLYHDMAIQSGISYQGKGFRDYNISHFYQGVVRVNTYYIQIPVHFLYKTKHFFIGGGPYMAIGTVYRKKTRSLTSNETKSVTCSFWSPPNGHFAGSPVPYDFGFGFQTGCYYKKFSIGVGSEFGLINFTDYDSNYNQLFSVFAAIRL